MNWMHKLVASQEGFLSKEASPLSSLASRFIPGLGRTAARTTLRPTATTSVSNVAASALPRVGGSFNPINMILNPVPRAGAVAKAPGQSSLSWYGRSLANLKPGENFWDKPLKSVWNTATTPFWDPFIARSNPRLASGLRAAARSATLAPTAVAAGSALSLPHDIATGVASNLGYEADEVRGVGQRAIRETPSIAWNTLTGSDPAARESRRWLANSGPQEMRSGMYWLRRNAPYVTAPADAISWFSPAGIVRNLASFSAQTPANNRNAGLNRMTRNILQEVGRNPEQVLNSPLAQNYQNIFGASPESAADLARRRLEARLFSETAGKLLSATSPNFTNQGLEDSRNVGYAWHDNVTPNTTPALQKTLTPIFRQLPQAVRNPVASNVIQNSSGDIADAMFPPAADEWASYYDRNPSNPNPFHGGADALHRRLLESNVARGMLGRHRLLDPDHLTTLLNAYSPKTKQPFVQDPDVVNQVQTQIAALQHMAGVRRRAEVDRMNAVNRVSAKAGTPPVYSERDISEVAGD